MSTQIVWFKRDLRLPDHAPLRQAAQHGPVLGLFAIEPTQWAQPDAARQHYHFMLECVRDLEAALADLGGALLVVHGDMPEVLDRLHAAQPIGGLWSHEETGHDASFQRDKAVARWCKAHAVGWTELPQFGVKRRLQNRDVWHRLWEAHMAAPVLAVPDLTFAALPFPSDPPPSADALGLPPHEPPRRQPGGRTRALRVLHGFLQERSAQYRGGISSPLSAPTACSRLSPHLAWGCLSMREVLQSTRVHVASLPPEAGHQKKGLVAFQSRLHWHCHFIQKLESEPELEWRNLHRGYDGLREHEWNDAHFQALSEGRTGWPMVDACVAMLRETGWVNFRMRAMLVSVSAYPLWLHWRPLGQWLARQFIDYEPGIHWSQLQMQSGTTGINTTRVYNPIKQAKDHDPQGVFVRRWIPAMRQVPDEWLFEPWRMPEEVQQACGVRVGRDIPLPVVELASATREAKTRLHALRAQPEVKAAKSAIVEKHGSRLTRDRHGQEKMERNRSRAGTRQAAAPEPDPQQLTFTF